MAVINEQPCVSAAELGVPETFNLATYFVDRHVTDGRGDKTAVECGDESVSYRQVRERANQVWATRSRALGVRLEQRVMLLLLDTPEFVYAFFGAMKIGAVPIPDQHALKPPDYEYILNDSRARVVDRQRSAAAAHRGDSARAAAATCARSSSSAMLHRPGCSPRRSAAGPGRSTELERRADEQGRRRLLAVLVGQHRLSQRVRPPASRHGRLRRAVREGHPRHHGATTAASASRSCSSPTASATRLYFPFAVGATTILLPGPPPPQRVRGDREASTRRCSSRSRRTTECCSRIDVSGADFDLSSIRLRRVRRRGAAAGAVRALQAALRRGDPRRHRHRPRSCTSSSPTARARSGRAPAVRSSPGTRRGLSMTRAPRARRRDRQSADRAATRTCAVLLEQAREDEGDDRRASGSGPATSTTQDADGYYWYAGRSDDMLKVGGIWVSPVEIENTLDRASGRARVRRRRPRGSRRADQAVRVRRAQPGHTGTPELAAELQQFVRERLAEYKRPRWVEFVAELPKTATGKIAALQAARTSSVRFASLQRSDHPKSDWRARNARSIGGRHSAIALRHGH